MLIDDLATLNKAISILYDLGNREELPEEYFKRIINVYYELQDIVEREMFQQT